MISQLLANDFLFVAICIILFVACVIDVKRRVVPNAIPICICCLWFIQATIQILYENWSYVVWHVIGAAVVCVFLIVVSKLIDWIAKKNTVKNEVNALGGGDIKLLSSVALYLGLNSTLICLVFACLVSILYAQAVHKRTFPFVPGITAGYVFIGILKSVNFALIV